ncbi:MAG: hypothetical protein K2Q22_12810, partial [Cytophagales bacterium]|nr:hypothetical protein [Cytophagales bacterium]
MKTLVYNQNLFLKWSMLILLFCLSFYNSDAQFSQNGIKLVGTGYLGNNGYGSSQGMSLSISADGKTLAVGGPDDGQYNIGAVWIYTLSGSNWRQVGEKLVSTEANYGKQGLSVSLSGDGKTLAVGAPGDFNYGAVLIYTFTGSNWSQAGGKLVGTGYSGTSEQGTSVCLSTDGKTLAVGGIRDNNYVGAAWIFTLSGGNWSQAGSKLVGTGYVNQTNAGVRQGTSISISGDGKILVVGARTDNTNNSGVSTGAVWTYSFTGSNWIQLGNKMTGAGDIGVWV